jgi:hypothetical protein
MRSISAGKGRRVALLREFERSGLTMATWRRSCRERPGAFVEVEPLESVAPPAARSTGSLCAELALPGGVVLRVYQINPTGGRA